MGTDKALFAEEPEELPEVTWPEVTSVTWPEMAMIGSDVSHVPGTESNFCACATGSCAMSASFHRKWRQSRDRKRPWPKEALSGSVRVRICNRKLCNLFPRFFYSSSSTSTMDTEGHPKGVRMRNRRLCTLHRKLATGSGGSRVVVHGGVL